MARFITSPVELNLIKSDENVLKKWRDIWIHNLCVNLPKLALLQTVNACTFPGTPACVIGPGPSLQGSLKWLRLLKGRAVIIALQRVYRKLVDADIFPDVVLTVDAADFVIDHFAGCPVQDLPILVLECSCSPRLFSLPTDNILVYEGRNRTLPFEFYSLLPEVTSLYAGYTVSSVAISLATFWKCNPMFMIGVDLGGNEGRYSGSDYKVPQDPNKKQLWLPKWGAKKDEYVKADIDLCLTHYWLENFALNFPKTLLIQCSEGGAKLRGWKHRKLKNMVRALPKKRTVQVNKYPPRKSDSYTRSKLLQDLSETVENALLKASDCWI